VREHEEDALRDDERDARFVEVQKRDDGSRLEILYSDENGEPTSKEEATNAEITEYDADGRVIRVTVT
jgi:YD repeat-containing protein